MDNPVLKLHWEMTNTIVVVCLFVFYPLKEEQD